MDQAPELINEVPFEHDEWSFTIRLFKTADGYTVQSFLRNTPVSHLYAIDSGAYEAQKASGHDPLAVLVDLARRDLIAGGYRQWIVHWAGH